MVSFEFIITALIVVLAPGTGVIYTVAVGLGRGRAASIAAATGCTLGIVPHILAATLGFAALLHTSALVFTLFKFAGAAYLIFLATQILRGKGSLSFTADKSVKSAFVTARTGFLINILNPKLSIFFLAFLPRFISVEADALGQMLVLSTLFMGMTFAVFAVYGAFAAYSRDLILGSAVAMKWIRRSTALAFGTMGVRLALSDT